MIRSKPKESPVEKIKWENPAIQKNEIWENYEEETWENEVVHHLKKQRFYAYCWAGLFAISTLLLTITVAKQMPLKTLVPIVIEVERSTGQVSIKTNLIDEIKDISERNAIIESFISKYVIARKTYEYTDNRERQDLIKMMSTPAVYRQYEQIWQSEDKNANPKLKYGLKDKAEVEIISIAQLNNTTHSVRLRVKEYYNGSNKPNYEQFVAIIQHEITPAGMSQADRWKNPIGFLVSSIRFDEEYID